MLTLLLIFTDNFHQNGSFNPYIESTEPLMMKIELL